MSGDIPMAQLHLDVREDIRRGQEPFARIMAAVKALADDQALVLRAPFEPIPLYEVLGKRGFVHWTERRASDDWSIWFYRDAAVRAEPTAVPATPAPRRWCGRRLASRLSPGRNSRPAPLPAGAAPRSVRYPRTRTPATSRPDGLPADHTAR